MTNSELSPGFLGMTFFSRVVVSPVYAKTPAPL
jgi:hypothetical protein